MYHFLLFIAIYLPFQLALNPMEGIDLASIRVLIIILFLAWLAQGLKNKKIIISRNMGTWLIISFLFLSALSIIVAQNTDWSMRKLLFLFSVFPIYFAAGQIINNKERMVGLMKFMVWGGAGAALVGIAQFVTQFVIGLEQTYRIWAKYVIVPFLGNAFGEAVLKNPSWLVNIAGETYLRATSFFPDPHMFSFYLGLLIPISIGLAIYSKEKRILFAIFAMILFVADILTFSRGGYVGLFFGLLFAGTFLWKKINKRYKYISLICLALALGSLLVPSPVSQRFLSSFDLKEGSNQGRLEMWSKATDVILDKPVLGAGIGNYPIEVSPTASYRDPIYAHNTYLDIAVETGILNSLVWLGIIGATIFGFWQKSKKEGLFFFAAMSIIVFAGHSLVETAIYSPVVFALFLLILSLNQEFKTSQDTGCPTGNEGERHPMSKRFMHEKNF